MRSLPSGASQSRRSSSPSEGPCRGRRAAQAPARLSACEPRLRQRQAGDDSRGTGRAGVSTRDGRGQGRDDRQLGASIQTGRGDLYGLRCRIGVGPRGRLLRQGNPHRPDWPTQWRRGRGDTRQPGSRLLAALRGATRPRRRRGVSPTPLVVRGGRFAARSTGLDLRVAPTSDC